MQLVETAPPRKQRVASKAELIALPPSLPAAFNEESQKDAWDMHSHTCYILD